MGLSGQVTRLVGHLGDRLDDIGLLARDVEHFPGKRFDAPAQPQLRPRTWFEGTLGALELLELRQLSEEDIGCVTEGLGVSHAG